MNNNKKLLAAALVTLGVATLGHATVDATITAINSDALEVWGLVKVFKVGVIGFMVAIGLVKMLRR